jgi:hypothetical protein
VIRGRTRKALLSCAHFALLEQEAPRDSTSAQGVPKAGLQAAQGRASAMRAARACSRTVQHQPCVMNVAPENIRLHQVKQPASHAKWFLLGVCRAEPLQRMRSWILCKQS